MNEGVDHPRDSQHPSGQVTVEVPRRRAFLVQSFGERTRGFWWRVVRAISFRRTPIPLHHWRCFLLRCFGASIGRKVRISPSATVDFPWNLTLGNDVVIEHRVIITCMGTVKIGDRCRLSQYAHLIAGTHDYRRTDMRIIRSPIDIGQDVWIAADSFVGPGVAIGDGAVLAARSSAFKDLPPGQVCIGEPARPVKAREMDSA